MITSSGNSKIKLVRLLLKDKKARDEHGLFVIEGVRLAEECLAAGLKSELILHSGTLSEKGKRVLDVLERTCDVVLEVETDLMDRISDTGTSQGILLVAAKPVIAIPLVLDFIIVLDQINIPGNLGTILRTAQASGAQTVFLTPNSVDVYNPKVVRAGMGAHFKLPIKYSDPAEIYRICTRRAEGTLKIMLSDVEGGTPCWDANLRQPLCMIIGNEANGISSEFLNFSEERIHIPMNSNSESLNAATAAGILLYEVMRQRRSK